MLPARAASALAPRVCRMIAPQPQCRESSSTLHWHRNRELRDSMQNCIAGLPLLEPVAQLLWCEIRRDDQPSAKRPVPPAPVEDLSEHFARVMRCFLLPEVVEDEQWRHRVVVDDLPA